MTIGIMQPYLLPYLGYFQLMDCVDKYVFCGDMQYIRWGWVNRNQLRIHNKKQTYFFTFPVVKDDHKKKINERYYRDLKRNCDKLKRSLYQDYRKAVNFEEAYSVLEKAMCFQNDNVACFNMNANCTIARYLGIETEISCTDVVKDEMFWYKFHHLEREDRAVYMCQYYNAQKFVNAIGGTALYHKSVFKDNGIDLHFLRMNDITYPQFGKEFCSNLSIIDVMMHNKIDELKLLLKKYQLE